MYPIGAIDATYIVAENEDGMYLIDQHAAHERINYEKYLEKLSNHDNTSIDLLVPIKIEMTLSLSDEEIGIFGDLIDPETGNTINITISQNWLKTVIKFSAPILTLT